MRALITGVGGFAGRYLAEYLARQTAWELFGAVRPPASGLPGTPGAAASVPGAGPAPPDWAADLGVRLVAADLTDTDQTRRLLAETRPDLVFHLAAQAIVQRALTDPQATLVNNLVGELNLLRGVRELGLETRLLLIGSSEEYGHVQPDDLPVDEETPFRPENPYAVSKIATDMLGLQFFIAYQMPIVRVRPFNHIGPRQSEHFVTSAFARQVARIEAGLQEPVIRVGNLNSERDFTDVRDMVRAYYLALTQGVPGEVYNIGSGQSVSIRLILEMLIGLSNMAVQIELDPTRMRPSDVPVIVCDPGRFQQQTGWQPEYALGRSLMDILNYWRERTQAEVARQTA
jgi:GDP-4-dehydro-6-deoxy-D-mannose reductase